MEEQTQHKMSEKDTRGGILRIKVDVTKIDKGALFKGTKGTYLDLSVLMRPDEDEYGNHGMAVQDLGQERREAGERGAILGNCKWASNPSASVSWVEGDGPAASQAAKPAPAAVSADPDDDMDEIPF